MPIVSESSFSPTPLLAQCDLQTILSSTLRLVPKRRYLRERIETTDSDFIDIDLVKSGSKKLVIVCHGLEGSSESPYIRGMVRALSHGGFDVAAKNFRGCSGEPNNLPSAYHSGSSNDLKLVVSHLLPHYEEISLVGFSLGGNVILKYLGELGETAPSIISSAVTFSVPVHLESCAHELARKRNYLYMNRFIGMLREKMTIKAKLFPQDVSVDNYHEVKTFADFDGRYIAPLHGFRDEVDYWTQSSSLPLLSDIKIPTLLVSALDDPFLPDDCYPVAQAKESEFFFLETPKRGGHVGFYETPWEKSYWSERRALEFLTH